MNRVILRWSGTGLVICALAALITSLAISQHTLSTKPVDGTYTGIAISLGIWTLAALELGTHLRTRARPPGENTKLRFDYHALLLDDAPLRVPLTVAAVYTLFLIVIMALTIQTGLFGMAGADQRQVVGKVALAQGIINFIFISLGGVFSIWGIRRSGI